MNSIKTLVILAFIIILMGCSTENTEEADAKITAVDDITSTPVVNNLSIIINRQLQLLNDESESNRIIYLLSDFQKSITDLEKIPLDSTVEVNMVPFSSVQEANIAIDSCWFETPTPMLNQNKVNLLSVKL